MTDITETHGEQLVKLGESYIDHIDRAINASYIAQPISDTLSANIRKDIVSLHTISTRLSIRLNSLNSPLLRLPDDVLRIVIDYLASTHDKERTWYSMAHVCNRLRYTVLGLASLWAEKVCMLHRKGALEEFLRRSADCPIRLEVPQEAMPLMRHDFSQRWLERAYLFKTDHTTLAWTIYQKPLPLLTDVELNVPPNETAIWAHSQDYSPMSRIDEESRYKILRTHDLYALPNLHRLSMTAIYIPVCSDSLTELRLFRTFKPAASSLPTLKQLLSFLRHCPHLEHLTLCGWLPVVPSDDTGDDEEEEGQIMEDPGPTTEDGKAQDSSHPIETVVPFLRLRVLELWGDHRRTAALWPYLTIPHTTEVSVRLGYLYDGAKEIIEYSRDLDNSHVLDSLHLFRSHLAAQPEERSVAALCIRTGNLCDSRLCFSLYSRRDEQMPTSPHRTQVPRLVDDGSHFPGYIEQAYTAILRLDICQHWWNDGAVLTALDGVYHTFRLTGIHALGLLLQQHIVENPSTIGVIFHKFPAVHRLELLYPSQATAINSLSRRLAIPNTESTDSLSPPHYLPHLNELILGVNPLSKSPNIHSTLLHNFASFGEHKQKFYEALIALAKARMAGACSSPLDCLFLRESNGSEPHIDPVVIEKMRQYIRVESDLE